MFKITIQKIERKTETVQGDWGIVNEVPYTEEDLATAYEKNEYKGKLNKLMGYRPETKKIVILEQTMLEQTVEELDLVQVIKAINGIK